MKHLYLLRHAQKAQNSEDADTPLSEKGEEQAKSLGNWVKQHDVKFDYILCSPSLRTKQTFELLNIEETPINFEAVLYDSMMSNGQDLINSLSEAIEQMSSNINGLLIIAHMPNLMRLCHFLSDTASLEENTILTFGYPSCGLVKIDLNIENWNEIKNARKSGKVSLLYS